MTACDLYVRLDTMLREGMIREDSDVFWYGTVKGKEIIVPVTGLEAGTREISIDKVDAKNGALRFGEVVP